MLLKRGTGSRERARGTGNRKMGTKQRIGNEVTEGPGFNLGFVPILILPFLLLVFRLRNIPFLACGSFFPNSDQVIGLWSFHKLCIHKHSSPGYHHVVWRGKTKSPSPKGLFVVVVTWRGSHIGGHYNKQFFEEFTLKWCLLPRGEKHLCSWSPTWPPWHHVQTSNSGY